MVREFHEAVNAPISLPFENYPEVVDLRDKLITEETQEVSEALDDMARLGEALSTTSPVTYNSLEVATLKELADLVYVVYGTAVAFGWDLDEAVERVHQSNMSKLVDGEPIKRADGKVLKGPDYVEPDLEDLVW
jgi:predicted HAD superfamily Cof-like phosphohydrolase